MNALVCVLLLLVTGLTLCRAQPGIYLAINALAYEDEDGNIVKRRLEVAWYGGQVDAGDRVVLSDSHGEVSTISPALHPDGFHIFPGNLPYPSLSELGYTPAILLY